MSGSYYTVDRISEIEVSALDVPLKNSLSDAKVLQGKQKALSGVYLTCVEIYTASGLKGEGYTYALRAGGKSQYELAREFAPLLIGEDPNDISRIWDKLSWAGNTLGENGLVNQVIAAFDTALWDLKARRAGLPLSRLFGCYKTEIPCYNTSAGYLTYSMEEVVPKAKELLAMGMGGIKLKVGQPDVEEDICRVKRLRKELGPKVPIMIDANQQWDLTTALKAGRALEECDLTWLEEPLNAHDLEGHKYLTDKLSIPVGTGEMLSSLSDVLAYIDQSAVNLIMPDCPRIGGITPFMKVLDRAREKKLMVAPHFVMEMHLALAATYSMDIWVEHIEWLQPLFNEKVVISNGAMKVPSGIGSGFTFNKEHFEMYRTAHEGFC